MNREAAATTIDAADDRVAIASMSGMGVPGSEAGRVAKAWAVVERFLVRAGDWLNPILVKETRQALKSFQFTVTFVLLLVACWVVTIGVLAVIGPRIRYAAEGSTLLMWYYAILAFPLAVVVPYAAFRSLAAEREDNTYDLLSITTLRPRQIISGKLGSAVVQMGVYFSAITPCLAFTYLLRGIDLPTIAVLLVYLFFWSLGLSMVGILFATLTKRRYSHVFASVGYVSMLLWLFIFPIVGTTIPMLQMSYSFLGEKSFWIGVLAAGTGYVTFFALAYFAAAGMIAFNSENRSTPLRICMLIQVAAFVGWVSAIWIQENYSRDAVLYPAMIALLYWYVMGALLTAERPGMSQRVKRSLPKSLLGRMFFSWFNPGPASGYMFAVANATALALVCYLALFISQAGGGRRSGWPGAEESRYLIAIGWGYLVAYLGLGLLIVTALRRIAVVTLLACVLIQFLMLLAGFGIPYAVKSMSLDLREAQYSFLQVTDPFLSLAHVANGGNLRDANRLLVIVLGAAICVLVANMPGVVRELRIVRQSAPKRVLDDEAELHPLPEPQPTSPWDESARA